MDVKIHASIPAPVGAKTPATQLAPAAATTRVTVGAKQPAPVAVPGSAKDAPAVALVVVATHVPAVALADARIAAMGAVALVMVPVMQAAQTTAPENAQLDAPVSVPATVRTPAKGGSAQAPVSAVAIIPARVRVTETAAVNALVDATRNVMDALDPATDPALGAALEAAADALDLAPASAAQSTGNRRP
jgi:hypothetical protein